MATLYMGTRTKRRHGIACAVLLIAAVALLPGCYEHVIRAEGPGAREREIHEPALKNDRTVVDDLEDAIMGPKR